MSESITDRDMELTSGIAAFESKQFSRAVGLLSPLAESGEPEAQYRIAIMAQNGLGMHPSPLLAYKYMKAAAKSGLAIAQHGLGFMYMEGECTEQDTAKAIEWLKKAAEQGLAGSQTTLGMIYKEGRGVEKDPEEARRWLRMAGFDLVIAAAGVVVLLGVQVGPVAASQICRDVGQATAAANRFADRGDGTVIDTATDLQWKRCSEGQTWSASTCQGEATRFNWHQALEYAEGVSFAGHSDWRVPSLVELSSIIEPACSDPAINLSVFPGTPSYAYWTSTPFEHFIRLGWAVYFSSGQDGYSPKDYAFFNVRLVRAGHE